MMNQSLSGEQGSIEVLLLTAKTKFSELVASRLLSAIMFSTGILNIILSIVFNLSSLAFIGLGLLFFGLILGYIRTESYIKKVLLDTTIFSQMATSNELVQELGCNGYAIYLPPKYFQNPDTQKVYLSKQKDTVLPTPEQIQNVSFFAKDSDGILLTPVGAELTRLFERILERNLIGVDLQYLQENLPKVLVELEVARSVSIRNADNSVLVIMEDCRFATLIEQSTFNDFSLNNSPLGSAIACALAKATGKPLIILAEKINTNGRDATIEFYLIDDFVIPPMLNK